MSIETMQQLLKFQSEIGSSSWQRADPQTALIEAIQDGQFLVRLKDGDRHHSVLLEVGENGQFRGKCDCKGFEFRSEETSPCAHLCTLRKAYFGRLTDVCGVPIEPRNQTHHKPPELATDGGQLPVAIGDRVYVHRFDKIGTVVKVDQKQAAINVDVRCHDGTEIKTTAAQVRLLDNPRPEPAGADGRVFGRPEGRL